MKLRKWHEKDSNQDKADDNMPTEKKETIKQ